MESLKFQLPQSAEQQDEATKSPEDLYNTALIAQVNASEEWRRDRHTGNGDEDRCAQHAAAFNAATDETQRLRAELPGLGIALGTPGSEVAEVA